MLSMHDPLATGSNSTHRSQNRSASSNNKAASAAASFHLLLTMLSNVCLICLRFLSAAVPVLLSQKLLTLNVNIDNIDKYRVFHLKKLDSTLFFGDFL